MLTLDRALKQKPIRMAGAADRHLYAPGRSATVLGWGAVKEGGRLIGLVSKGDGCARPDHPAIYARVDAINSWVAEEVLR